MWSPHRGVHIVDPAFRMVYIQRFRTTFISPVHNAGFRGIEPLVELLPNPPEPCPTMAKGSSPDLRRLGGQLFRQLDVRLANGRIHDSRSRKEADFHRPGAGGLRGVGFR